MLPTSAGVEPATSWSPLGRRIHRGRLFTNFEQSFGSPTHHWCFRQFDCSGESTWPNDYVHSLLLFLTPLQVGCFRISRFIPDGFFFQVKRRVLGKSSSFWRCRCYSAIWAQLFKTNSLKFTLSDTQICCFLFVCFFFFWLKICE